MKKNDTQMSKFSATASIRLSLEEGTALLKRADTLGKGVRMAVENFISGSQTQSVTAVDQIDWNAGGYVEMRDIINRNKLSPKAAAILWNIVLTALERYDAEYVQEEIDKLNEVPFD